MESDFWVRGTVTRVMQAIERMATPWMVRPASPTADLYLLNACGDWVGEGRPITQLAPGAFVSETTLLVMRHAGGAATLPERARQFYLIDDDVNALVADVRTPMGQRLKLALFERRYAAALRHAGAQMVVSSDALLRLHPSATLLRPVWSAALADLDHHGKAGPCRIAYLGSAVHRGDLALIGKVLWSILETSDVELYIAANHRLSKLSGHPKVKLIAATSWPAWRAWIEQQRFHIALYPLADSAANRARSCNKIIEHAVVGAAGIYSDTWPEAARVSRRSAGLVLPADPRQWELAIRSLIDDRQACLRLAKAGRALAQDLNGPGVQRAFWSHAFSLFPFRTT